jgi:hypothetical protein
MKCHVYVQRMQFYHLWYIISARWPNSVAVHCLKTIHKIIKHTAQQILILTDDSNFSSSVACGRFLYARSLKNPHNKSGTVKSGERAGHGMCYKILHDTPYHQEKAVGLSAFCTGEKYYSERFIPNSSWICLVCVIVASRAT